MDLNDRELLELAAKASGREVGREDQGDPIDRKYSDGLGLWCIGPYAGWFNPLGNAGEALRLAARLSLEVNFTHPVYVCVYTAHPVTGGMLAVREFAHDRTSAACRAIVKVAAEFGKAMP